MSEFKKGDLLKRLHIDDRTFYEAGYNCDSIIVEMENGQMAPVPWFEVWDKGSLIAKFNGAFVLSVEYE